ncbi:carboxylesterase 1-like [Rutidosis leptorrhynchoides]|uniref:carboxylesterase 1-like n=1 Tax=Rutidosis leptorrhynchoides TaxID=125765 RepID=UPI003A9920F0
MSAHKSPIAILNSDGSCTRFVSLPCSLPTPDPNSNTRVLSKDITINPVTKTWVRIYIPKQTLTNTITPIQKLPLIVYYHGGGFVIMSASTTVSHDFCNQLATHLPAVIVSVDYRLAPEHRLPAAYDDGVKALNWVKSTQEPWLIDFADFCNCYLMGTSAGANIAYHVGQSLSSRVNDGEVLKIKGLMLHNLFIGGVKRTESEIQLGNVGQLTLSHSDTFWDLSLPVGANRDHEYCNVMAGSVVRVMMTIRDGDLLIDRQMEFAKMLESKGVEIKCIYGEGDHGIEYFDMSKAVELFEEISNFMSNVD